MCAKESAKKSAPRTPGDQQVASTSGNSPALPVAIRNTPSARGGPGSRGGRARRPIPTTYRQTARKSTALPTVPVVRRSIDILRRARTPPFVANANGHGGMIGDFPTPSPPNSDEASAEFDFDADSVRHDFRRRAYAIAGLQYPPDRLVRIMANGRPRLTARKSTTPHWPNFNNTRPTTRRANEATRRRIPVVGIRTTQRDDRPRARRSGAVIPERLENFRTQTDRLSTSRPDSR